MPDVRTPVVARGDWSGQFFQYRDPLIGVLDYIAEVSPGVIHLEHLSNFS